MTYSVLLTTVRQQMFKHSFQTRLYVDPEHTRDLKKKKTLFNCTKQDKMFLSCFVQLKSVLLISCVFWAFFSERWQSTLFPFFFFLSRVLMSEVGVWGE